MKVQTLTVVVGTTACNAHCPYCVSKMTPRCGAERPPPINLRNFAIACAFARQHGVSTVLLTGKGEPTLFPEEISIYVSKCHAAEFPFIELQTNGILFLRKRAKFRAYLESWYAEGMTTVSVSVAHYDPVRNAQIFVPTEPEAKVYDPWQAVDELHALGFSVRLNCTLVRGWVDSVPEVDKLMAACRAHGVEQTTIRSVTRPAHSVSAEVGQWVDDHAVPGLMEAVQAHLVADGAVPLLTLPYGAIIYDWHGLNLCLGNCLTSTADPEQIRQLIFFPDGHLRYDWKYAGAILL